ncbi:hypothetical protein Q75_07035 [Bacillus coahuilensis p1.1.43]|uniref:VanZ-like domain-containing protein n=2 Tax=Bacillus coahuilensis TaxID=408580 RepID=A0A147K949_9BACI|nr:hypothetical protein Q75_07035 [Bacillus coahuilensis p1.1.43]
MRCETVKIFIRGIVIMLFCTYLTILFYLLFFSNYRTAVSSGQFQGTGINLIPFKSIYEHIRTAESYHFTDNLIGNILAFIPFGFFLPVLKKTYIKMIKLICITFAFSASIEYLQYVFKVGALDVDDICLNVIGSLIGYYLFSTRCL